jgi:butyrate kinase
MSSKTEKKLENLENDVEVMEQKFKEFAERIRAKKAKTEETRNLAIVEIVREQNVSISDLKAMLSKGGKQIGNAPPHVRTTKAVTSAAEEIKIRKDNEHEEID